MLRDRSLRMARPNVERGKEDKGEAPEIVIHQVGEPAYVVFHSLVPFQL